MSQDDSWLWRKWRPAPCDCGRPNLRHSGQEPQLLTQTHPKLWMGCTGWAFRSPGLVSASGMQPTPPCWLQLPLAPSGELVHAPGVNHVPWQPSRLRNRKEFKEKLPRYRSHPGPLKASFTLWLGRQRTPKKVLGCLHTCVCAPPFSFSRSDSLEGGLRALTAWPLTTRGPQCLLQLEDHVGVIPLQFYPWWRCGFYEDA